MTTCALQTQTHALKPNRQMYCYRSYVCARLWWHYIYIYDVCIFTVWLLCVMDQWDSRQTSKSSPTIACCMLRLDGLLCSSVGSSTGIFLFISPFWGCFHLTCAVFYSCNPALNLPTWQRYILEQKYEKQSDQTGRCLTSNKKRISRSANMSEANYFLLRATWVKRQL